MTIQYFSLYPGITVIQLNNSGTFASYKIRNNIRKSSLQTMNRKAKVYFACRHSLEIWKWLWYVLGLTIVLIQILYRMMSAIPFSLQRLFFFPYLIPQRFSWMMHGYLSTYLSSFIPLLRNKKYIYSVQILMYSRVCLYFTY